MVISLRGHAVRRCQLFSVLANGVNCNGGFLVLIIIDVLYLVWSPSLPVSTLAGIMPEFTVSPFYL